MARILVVEDCENLRGLFQKTLAAAGHAVTVASEGNDAIRILDKGDFDLLVTDIIMPGLDGFEVIQAAKKKFPKLPIIAISGGGRNGAMLYLSVARKFGVQKTLAKPFIVEELCVAADEILGGAVAA